MEVKAEMQRDARKVMFDLYNTVPRLFLFSEQASN